MNRPAAHRNDVLNALVCDLLADQVRRALELGFNAEEVQEAVRRGLEHGVYEFKSRRTDR
jgi:hypothetical protein